MKCYLNAQNISGQKIALVPVVEGYGVLSVLVIEIRLLE